MTTPLYRLLNLLALSVCLSPVALGATGAGVITQLSTGSAASQQNSPAISGTRVVWANVFSLPMGASNSDIFFLDVSGAAAPLNITNTANDQEFLQGIDGSQIVYAHTSASSAGDIFLYDAIQGTSSAIALATPTASFEEPAIRGRYIAFVSAGSTQLDIQLYDTLLGVTTPVTQDAAAQARPRLGADMLVYEDYSTGHAQVFGYRISTNGPAVALAAGAGSQITPDIDGNTVVWIETTSTGEQVFTLNLTTNAVTQLTTAVSDKIQPRISGNRIVWSDDRNGDLDLYMYDLTSNTETPLVTGLGDQFLPDIDGDRVVFVSNETGFQQIYQIVLNAGDFSVSASPTGINLTQGATGSSLISTAVTSGTAATVNLSVSGLPNGASASLNPAAVTAGGSSNLTITSGTAAPGVYTLTVTGTEGSLTHTATVILTVVGGPQLSVTPTSIDFGTVPRFGLRLATATLNSVGTSPVLISSVSVVLGANADVDDFTPISLCASSLAPGKSCSILLLFFADDLGTRAATLTITDNAQASPQSVALTANVIKR